MHAEVMGKGTKEEHEKWMVDNRARFAAA